MLYAAAEDTLKRYCERSCPQCRTVNMSHIPKRVSKDAAPSPIVKMNASLYAFNSQNK
jgi:phage FluMu protein Com